MNFINKSWKNPYLSNEELLDLEKRFQDGEKYDEEMPLYYNLEDSIKEEIKNIFVEFPIIYVPEYIKRGSVYKDFVENEMEDDEYVSIPYSKIPIFFNNIYDINEEYIPQVFDIFNYWNVSFQDIYDIIFASSQYMMYINYIIDSIDYEDNPMFEELFKNMVYYLRTRKQYEFYIYLQDKYITKINDITYHNKLKFSNTRDNIIMLNFDERDRNFFEYCDISENFYNGSTLNYILRYLFYISKFDLIDRNIKGNENMFKILFSDSIAKFSFDDGYNNEINYRLSRDISRLSENDLLDVNLETQVNIKILEFLEDVSKNQKKEFYNIQENDISKELYYYIIDFYLSSKQEYDGRLYFLYSDYLLTANINMIKKIRKDVLLNFFKYIYSDLLEDKKIENYKLHNIAYLITIFLREFPHLRKILDEDLNWDIISESKNKDNYVGYIKFIYNKLKYHVGNKKIPKNFSINPYIA